MSERNANHEPVQGLIHICKVTETIKVPVEMVWSVVSAFGAIKMWMPGIDSCHVKEDGPQPPTVGAVRAVANLGMVMEETLEVWDLKEHYTVYRLKDPCPWPLKGCRGSIRATSKGDNTTELVWSVDAEEISEEASKQVGAALIPFINSGIGELRRVLTRPQQPY